MHLCHPLTIFQTNILSWGVVPSKRLLGMCHWLVPAVVLIFNSQLALNFVLEITTILAQK